MVPPPLALLERVFFGVVFKVLSLVGSSSTLPLECVLHAGEELLRAGEDLLRAGEDLLHAGEDLLPAGEGLLHAGEELRRFGDDIFVVCSSVFFLWVSTLPLICLLRVGDGVVALLKACEGTPLESDSLSLEVVLDSLSLLVLSSLLSFFLLILALFLTSVSTLTSLLLFLFFGVNGLLMSGSDECLVCRLFSSTCLAPNFINILCCASMSLVKCHILKQLST